MPNVCSLSLYISPQILAPDPTVRCLFIRRPRIAQRTFMSSFVVWILSTSDPTVQEWWISKDAPSNGPPLSKEINDDSPRADETPRDVR